MKLKLYFIYLLSGIVLISSCSKKKRQKGLAEGPLFDSKFVKKEYGIWINESTLCENVANRKPVNPSSEFETRDTVKVYFFTRIGCKKPGQTIFHRYAVQRDSLEGGQELWEQVHITDLPVKSTNYRTWSYKTTFPGKWRVDILAPDKESIIKAHIFNVIGPEKEMPALDVDIDYDINKLKLADSTLCESVEDNEPVEPVEEFILNKGEQHTKVWVWMKFECEAVPVKVFLRWSRWVRSVVGEDGWTPEVTYLLNIKGKKWRTKGVKSCGKGNWRLDIIGPDGDTVLKTFEFEVRLADR